MKNKIVSKTHQIQIRKLGMAGNSKFFIYDMADFESAHRSATKLSIFLGRVAF